MKNIFGIGAVLIGASFLLSHNAALASQWQIVGPRAIGMGGAHVAVVSDATAQYWNPAAFGFFGRQSADDEKSDEHSDKDFGIHIQAGAGYQSHEDIIAELDQLQQYDSDAVFDNVSGGFSNISGVDDYIMMISELEDLAKSDIGVTALANAGANVRLKNWAIGYMTTLDISAIPTLDLINVNPNTGGADFTAELGGLQGTTNADSNLDALTPAQFSNLSSTISSLGAWDGAETVGLLYALDDALAAEGYDNLSSTVPQQYIDGVLDVAYLADSTAGAGTFDNNSSFMEFKGAIIQEVPLTYGHAYNDNLSVGVNLKAMKARTYYYKVAMYDSDTEDLFEDVEDVYEESSAVGLDLGVLYKTGGLRLGLVARNINKPSFDFAGPGDYEIDPQLRAGLSYRLWNRLTVAADLDITENDTNVSDDYKSRNLGVGLEADLWILNLRGGAYQNISESDIGPVYTAGLGIDLYLFQLDAGLAWSKDSATIEGEDIREEVRGELALSFQY